MDLLDPQKIKEAIDCNARVRERVREVFLFEQVASTNQIAAEMGSAGTPGGVLILANGQSQGRGRLNREWISPEGVNLYFSLLARPSLGPAPPVPPRDFPLFSLAAAVAVATAIRSATGLKANVKWPNDILIGDRKVAGILLEAGQSPPYLVIGIGINVNWNAEEIPPHLNATSLKAVMGHAVDRSDLLLAVLDQLAVQWSLLEAGRKDRVIAAMSAVCGSLGQQVRVTTPGATWEGRAEAIGEDGGLLLRLANGTPVKVLLGDVTHCRPVAERE